MPTASPKGSPDDFVSFNFKTGYFFIMLENLEQGGDLRNTSQIATGIVRVTPVGKFCIWQLNTNIRGSNVASKRFSGD
jgi:hypothetical protein